MNVVCESRIDGDFEGWDGETVYKLQNGQVWKQSQYFYHYHYSYCPKVTIFQGSSGYEMHVAGDSYTARVIRIK